MTVGSPMSMSSAAARSARALRMFFSRAACVTKMRFTASRARVPSCDTERSDTPCFANTLAEAPSYGEPVTVYDRKSAGAQAYLKLADEILGEEAVKE